MSIDNVTKKKILNYQINEITEYHIYMKLARKVASPKNRETLKEFIVPVLLTILQVLILGPPFIRKMLVNSK